uniref:Large ribosomal subunit protein uL22c n=1 Tax=Monococcus echinophorus TaxID=1227758 RepID=A0A411L4W0_9CARY|nr:ribosomal protein L22 [Monococcus echinophorus]QBE87358.1 ribosomal protein L22 [Monococcus echinophorus]
MRKKLKRINNIEEGLIRKAALKLRVRRRDDVYAFSQYIPMAAAKVRRVIDQIRGNYYEKTLILLELMPYRACYHIFKLIHSAAANANHNKGFDKAYLLILKAEVNKGTTMKKLKPRARGRSYLIKRPTCHINIVLRDMSYFAALREYMETVPKYKQQQALGELRAEGIDVEEVLETEWYKKEEVKKKKEALKKKNKGLKQKWEALKQKWAKK